MNKNEENIRIYNKEVAIPIKKVKKMKSNNTEPSDPKEHGKIPLHVQNYLDLLQIV